MNLVINKNNIEVLYADKFKLRLFGLMFKKNINQGIFFPKCNSIHTFFMQDKIDVLMLDKNYKIIHIFSNFKKNRIIYKKGIKHTIELPKNTINMLNIKVNDHIKIVN